MKNKIQAALVLVALLSLLTACKATVEPEEVVPPGGGNDPSKKIGALVGKKYILKSIEREGEPDYRAPSTDMTLILDSLSQLHGKILCNFYTAEVEWDDENNFLITDLDIENQNCGRRPPFNFLNSMKYKILGKYIYLIAPAGSWQAVFVQTEEELIFNVDGGFWESAEISAE